MTQPAFPTRDQIQAQQHTLLHTLLRTQLSADGFHAHRLRKAGITTPDITLEDFSARCPLLTKKDLRENQSAHPPYGTFSGARPEDITRLHQTSSTTGDPLRWPDTAADWDAMVTAWCEVCRAAGITAQDRVFAAASFGPFIGFWLGFEAAERLGAMVIPGGGMTTAIRLRAILGNDVTAVLCTPTYAIRLGEAARDEGIDLSKSAVRTLIVAGEPGGSVPAVRDRIHALWGGATVFDHHGMTECGPATHECPDEPCTLHLLEPHLYCEFINPDTLDPVDPNTRTDEDDPVELVITSLARPHAPVLRYRTGDLVQPIADTDCSCGRHTRRLKGGIVARADDMVVVRGVNVYPSAVDGVVRAIDGIDEYRVDITEHRGMTELTMTIESSDPSTEAVRAQEVEHALREAFGLRICVEIAPHNTLPRAEFKSSRWKRSTPTN